MGMIFWGLVLAFFNFTVTNGTMTINLVPNFIGCLLICFGLRKLAGAGHPDAGHFEKAAKLALPLFIYSAAIYAADLLGMTINYPLISLITGLLYLLYLLYVVYLLVQGLINIENETGKKLDTVRLKAWWRYIGIFNIICCAITIIVYISGNTNLAIVYYVCSTLSFFCELTFLMKLFTAGNVLKRK